MKRILIIELSLIHFLLISVDWKVIPDTFTIDRHWMEGCPWYFFYSYVSNGWLSTILFLYQTQNSLDTGHDIIAYTTTIYKTRITSFTIQQRKVVKIQYVLSLPLYSSRFYQWSDEVCILFQKNSIYDIASMAALFEDDCQLPPLNCITWCFCKGVKITAWIEIFIS